MQNHAALFLFGALAASSTIGAEVQLDPLGLGYDPFPKFEEIDKSELYPQGGKLSVAKDGSLLVDGKPRYFTATIWYGATEFECNEDTPGYVPELKWLYQEMPDYEAMQRIGLDAGGTEAPLDWMRDLYRPWMKPPRRDNKRLSRSLANGLPVYVDFTASEWSHGSMWPHDNPLDPDSTTAFVTNAATGDPGRLPHEAWSGGGNKHWVPYSVVHPKGRAIWLNMWEHSASNLLANGVTPWCYELFNEPSVFEESDYARQQFVEAMKAKYGSIGSLNEAWANAQNPGPGFSSFAPLATNHMGCTAARVEYTKFIEGCFASLCAEGADRIAKVQPGVLACFQPTFTRTRGIDLYRTNEKLGVICSPTGGNGGIVEAAMLRGMADGKPIVDSEMYIGTSSNSIRNAFMTQYQRGFSVSYAFKWSRRPCDWRRVHEVVQTEGRWKGFKLWQMWPEESLKNAMKVSAYNFMHPYRVTTDQLLGIRTAKRDVLDVNEFFTPRDRGVPHEVAILFSTPTEHLGQAEGGHASYKLFDQAVMSLEFSHLLSDVIFEEQITNSLARLGQYKVLVAPGTDATYAGTCKRVNQWVEKGGVLVLLGESMHLNEYGGKNPEAFTGIEQGKLKESEQATIDVLGVKVQGSCYSDTTLDASWEVLGRIGDQVVVARKKFGRGTVWYLNGKFSGDAIGDLVKLAAKDAGVTPCAETLDALSATDKKFLGSIELDAATCDDLDAYMLTARTLRDVVTRFKPRRPMLKMVRVWNDPTQAYRQEIMPDKEGYYTLELPAGDPVMIVGGTKAQIDARYPQGPKVVWMAPLTSEAALAQARQRMAEKEAERLASKPAFNVDPNRTTCLDIRKFANRRFTEQGGGMSLAGTPWGVELCSGIPMDFIRYDQNEFKDVIVLASSSPKDETMPAPEKIEGIRVDQKASSLYFLHAVINPKEGEVAFGYIVHYADGTDEKVAVTTGKEVGGQRKVAATDKMNAAGCYRGWKNADGDGFTIFRWLNPNPDKQIASLDIVSRKTQQIPVVAAITAQRPEPKMVKIQGLMNPGGSTGVKGLVTNDVWKVYLDEKASSWATANVNLSPGLKVDPKKCARVTFEVNRLPDAWGQYHDHATPQFKLNGRDANGKLVFGNWVVPHHIGNGSPFYRTDNDPSTWEKVYIGAKEANFIPDWYTQIISIALQFQVMPSEHSGLEMRNFIIEEVTE